jgi:hypothetical protein
MRPMIAMLAVALVSLACNLASPTPTAPSGGSGTASGPGISVADALRSTANLPLLVNGAVFITPEGVRLCSAVAESFPPQCGGDRIEVRGLDPSTIPGLQTEGNVSWAEQVQVLGTVQDGVLVMGAVR